MAHCGKRGDWHDDYDAYNGYYCSVNKTNDNDTFNICVSASIKDSEIFDSYDALERVRDELAVIFSNLNELLDCSFSAYYKNGVREGFTDVSLEFYER